MTGDRIRAAVCRAEVPMMRAYGLWFEHVLRCADCKSAGTAKDGCATGHELWDAYRAVRIGRTR